MKKKNNSISRLAAYMNKELLKQSEIDSIKDFSLSLSVDKQLKITGVKEIKSFDFDYILLDCKNVTLEIQGSDLQIETLMPYEIAVSGSILNIGLN